MELIDHQSLLDYSIHQSVDKSNDGMVLCVMIDQQPSHCVTNTDQQLKQNRNYVTKSRNFFNKQKFISPARVSSKNTIIPTPSPISQASKQPLSCPIFNFFGPVF